MAEVFIWNSKEIRVDRVDLEVIDLQIIAFENVDKNIQRAQSEGETETRQGSGKPNMYSTN